MLYQKLGGAALSKTLYIVPRQDVAEEILQEVFIKLWNKKVQFESLRQAYSWVYRACTNAAIDFLRKKANQTAELLEEVHEVDDAGVSPIDQASLKQLLGGLLKELNDDESSYFIYHHVEGMTQNEIAEVLGVSRRTVVRLQQRVQAKLEKFRGR